MRILTVSAFYENHGGGIEIAAGQMARALARRGHDCRWAAASFDPTPQDALLQPVPLPASDPLERWTGLPMPILDRAARVRLRREVEEADAVIIHDALYLSSQLAARYARLSHKPWILVQHIGAIPYTNILLRLAMAAANTLAAWPLVRSAPQVVFISDLVRRFFAASLQPDRAALLFNGVDHQLFRAPTKTERSKLRRRLNMQPARPQLLFVGRFVEKKGLAALRSLAATNPEWDLLLVGSGPIDPGSWELPNVRLLGRKTREEVAEIYRAVDAIVLPSVGEGFPLVVQEAMASGLPVFCGLDSASADPEARTLLHGIDVDPSDPNATAARFAAAIACSPLGPEIKLAGYARKAYDWDSNALSLEEQLGKLQGEAPIRNPASLQTPRFEGIPAPSARLS
jgi:starch synthase